MCNKEVKFGAFLKKALSMGADFVATGHYAQTGERKISDVGIPQGGSPTSRNLSKGVDPSKDQVYFLWTLNQKQLSKIIFPIGNLKKTEVRKLAKKFNLPVAQKKDSQGICFLGAIDLKEFLKHYLKSKKGKVLNKFGKEIGFHDGAVFHTLGERHGFTITKKTPHDGAYYIIGKDVKKNILVVSQNQKFTVVGIPQGGSPTTVTKLEQVNWISEIPKPNKNYTAQIRYHGEFLNCKIKILSKNKCAVIFDKFVQVASGQSCVVYDKDVCLGGGVVV
jgi:tRNA-specific 2-thiouridylase